MKINQPESGLNMKINQPESGLKSLQAYLEVLEFVSLDFQSLLNDVVDDEKTEDCLTSHHKVVTNSHISDQLHGTECPRWNGST